MPVHGAVVAFSNSRTCFLTVPENWIKRSAISQDSLPVFQIQHGEKTSYFSCKGDATLKNIVQLNGKYAAKLGIKDKAEVLVTHIAQLRVSEVQKVFLEPVSSDDWEMISLNSNVIETELLNQIRVIWKDQVFPVWAHQTSFYLKVAEVVPDGIPSLLVEWTELHVVPKERNNFLPSEAGLSQNQKKKDKYSQYKHLTKTKRILKKQKQPEVSSPFSVISENTESSNDSIDIFSNNTDNINNSISSRPFSIFRNIMKSVFQNEGKEQQSFEDETLDNEFLPLDFDFRLRVIPCSKGASSEALLPLALQATTVFISHETFTSHYGSSSVPDCFVAKLTKLLSPAERKEEIQTQLSDSKTGSKSKTEKDKKSNGKELSFESVCVNVMVLKSPDTEFNVPETLFISSGYISVPLELKRRLGLEVASIVHCRSVDYAPYLFNRILLYPLENLHVSFVDSSASEAFMGWIEDANLEESSLVICDGTLVKLTIKKGKTCDFVILLSQSDIADISPLSTSPLSIGSPSFSGSDSEKSSSSSSLSTAPSLPNYGFINHIKLKRISVRLGAYSPHFQKSALSNSIALNKILDLYQSIPALGLEALGGVKEISEKAMEDFEFALKLNSISASFPDTNLNKICMLIHGPKGVGKSALIKALCKRLVNYPYFVFAYFIRCLPLRGKRVETISKKWELAVSEAIHRLPSILIFEDLDQLASAPATPEQEAGPDGTYFLNIAQVFISLVKRVIINQSRTIIVVTSKSFNSLHPALTATKGCHIFHSKLEIKPPDGVQRSQILHSLVLSKLHISSDSIPSISWEHIVSKTEGYVAQDLDVLVDKATHVAWSRIANSVESNKNVKDVTLIDEDFDAALEAYTPSSLRGLQLHKGNDKSWKDVGGLRDAKRAIQEILTWPVKYKFLFKNCTLKPQCNILLYGEPGTGKTLLAGTVANECELNFISIKGPELLSKYIGASEQAVRDLFVRAASAKPCILFFDEFDALAPRRGHDSTGVTDRVVNQLLTQLDGVEDIEGVYILAATSRPELIDPALLRPGRLDRCVHCPLPDENDRQEILEALSSKLSLSDDVDFQAIIPLTEHFSGADLQALLYSAQIEALHDNRNKKSRAPSNSSADFNYEKFSENIVYMPTVEEGIADPSDAEAQKIIKMVHVLLSDKENTGALSKSSRSRSRSIISTTIEQKHLLKVLSEMKPSVTAEEQSRYKRIFEKFKNSRSSDFVSTIEADVKRVTLA